MGALRMKKFIIMFYVVTPFRPVILVGSEITILVCLVQWVRIVQENLLILLTWFITSVYLFDTLDAASLHACNTKTKYYNIDGYYTVF